MQQDEEKRIRRSDQDQDEHKDRRPVPNPSSHDDEAMTEYDKTVADSFPASDPPSA